LILWSRRRYGRVLPGLIGLNIFLTYYLSQDNAVAGQRDWHGAFFATAGFFALDLLSGRAGRIVSGLAVGAALSIRPQFILVVPGMLLALGIASRGAGEHIRPGRTILAWAEWGIAAGLMFLVAFLPLMADGLLPDFIRCIRSISYGAGLTPSVGLRASRFARNLVDRPELPFTLLALMAVTRRGLGTGWGETGTIVLLQLSMLGFAVLSPINHAYYQIPVTAYFAIVCAHFSGLLLLGRPATATATACLILLIGLTAGVLPTHIIFKPTIIHRSEPATAGGLEVVASEKSSWPRIAMRYYLRGRSPTLVNYGRHETIDRYPWEDYRATIEYLRRSTTPETPVANLLLDCNTAVTGAIPRISPLPCDSVGLCSFPSLIQGDLDALRSTVGCVVVWDPGLSEGRWTELAPLFDVVRERYHPEARFGNIEVWRRNVDPPR
jgi:hypothetical protein